MKKSMKMLVKGISLALVLSLVLSVMVFVPVFAEENTDPNVQISSNEDGTVTATYTYDTGVSAYANDTSGLYKFIKYTNSDENDYYIYNVENEAFYYKFPSSSFGSLYDYAAGGTLMKMPITAFNIPSNVTVDNILSATLSMTLRYNSGAVANNDSTRILLHNISASEYAVISNASFANFYNSSTAANHVPASLASYVTSGSAGTFTKDSYKDGYLNSTLKPGDTNWTQVDGTTLDYKYSFDITELIKDGSLTEERYLLIQRAPNYNSSNAKFYSGKAYYLPVYTYKPVLTIKYDAPTSASKIESHGSLLEAGNIVTIQNGYGYKFTFDGALLESSVTKDNVLVTDSEGAPVTGYTVALAEDGKTIEVLFPSSTVNNSVDFWLTAGETYNITLTNGVKNSNGNVIFSDGQSYAVTMAATPEYQLPQNEIRITPKGSETVETTIKDSATTTLTVGASGTNEGDKLQAYMRLDNFTEAQIPLHGIIAVYDNAGSLVGVSITTNSPKAEAGKRSGYVTPAVTLTKDLQAGYKIKSFLWTRDGALKPLNTSGNCMMEITVVEQ